MARRREWQRHAAQVGRARRLGEHEARDLLERALVAEVRGAHLTHEAGAIFQLPSGEESGKNGETVLAEKRESSSHK